MWVFAYISGSLFFIQRILGITSLEDVYKRQIRFFTKDEQVIVLGVSLLRIVAISEPMYAALIIYEGIFHEMCIRDSSSNGVFCIYNSARKLFLL